MLFLISGLLLLSFTYANPSCALEQLDVVFVVDESSSFGSAYFATSLEASAEMVNSLPIGSHPSDSRVAFVKYGNSAQLGFNLDRYYTKNLTVNAIKALSYNGGGTNIAAGMDMAIREVFVPYGRKNARKVMILMTDGDDTSDVASEQRLASENDIIIYAIRIAANATDENELVNAVGDASRVFTAVNFVGLSNAIEAICKDIGFSSSSVSTPQLPLAKSCGCDDVKQLSKLRYWLDMIFIVDTSDAISTEDFASIKNVLLTMTRTNVNTMMNETNGQYSRMGIINFGKTAEVFTELNNTFPECEYRNFIRQKFSSIGGSSTGIRDALVLAHDMFGNEENAGNRLGFKKVVVLFTTAGIKCYHLVDGRQKLIASEFCELVSAMKNNGVTFITVALKEPGAAKYPLIDIASECNTFPADSHVNENLLRAFCRANCFCKDGFTQLSLGDDGCRKYGECYRVNFLPLSYNAASSACKEIGGRLPDASFEEKDNFIKDLHVSAKFFPFWISQRCDSFLSCNADRNYSIASNSYVNWCSTSYPDFSQGNCVYEDRCNEAVTGWFNADCNDITTNRFFACQIDACSASNFCSS